MDYDDVASHYVCDEVFQDFDGRLRGHADGGRRMGVADGRGPARRGGDAPTPTCRRRWHLEHAAALEGLNTLHLEATAARDVAQDALALARAERDAAQAALDVANEQLAAEQAADDTVHLDNIATRGQ